jgi:hypothetical protein
MNYIYDLCYNDRGEYVIISPMETTLTYELSIDNGKSFLKPTSILKCAHRHTYVFVWQGLSQKDAAHIKCGSEIQSRHVTTYPIYTGKTLMSTIVLNENKWVRQWIAYHLARGVDHMIIYNNEPGDTLLAETVQDYIASGQVLVIPWPYSYRLPVSGISGQTTQQTHSIWTWKTARWIGLLDVDEYVVPKGAETQIPALMDAIAGPAYGQLGGIQLLSRIFDPPADADYRVGGTVFFTADRCTNVIVNEREKIFVNPANVGVFSVHMITVGLKQKRACAVSQVLFHHYWFLGGLGRMTLPKPNSDRSIYKFLDATQTPVPPSQVCDPVVTKQHQAPSESPSQ